MSKEGSIKENDNSEVVYENKLKIKKSSIPTELLSRPLLDKDMVTSTQKLRKNSLFIGNHNFNPD